MIVLYFFSCHVSISAQIQWIANGSGMGNESTWKVRMAQYASKSTIQIIFEPNATLKSKHWWWYQMCMSFFYNIWCSMNESTHFQFVHINLIVCICIIRWYFGEGEIDENGDRWLIGAHSQQIHVIALDRCQAKSNSVNAHMNWWNIEFYFLL